LSLRRNPLPNHIFIVLRFGERRRNGCGDVGPGSGSVF
jgi:hypothetical protein